MVVHGVVPAPPVVAKEFQSVPLYPWNADPVHLITPAAALVASSPNLIFPFTVNVAEGLEVLIPTRLLFPFTNNVVPSAEKL